MVQIDILTYKFLMFNFFICFISAMLIFVLMCLPLKMITDLFKYYLSSIILLHASKAYNLVSENLITFDCAEKNQ